MATAEVIVRIAFEESIAFTHQIDGLGHIGVDVDPGTVNIQANAGKSSGDDPLALIFSIEKTRLPAPAAWYSALTLALRQPACQQSDRS